jgi:hypothetical protein
VTDASVTVVIVDAENVRRSRWPNVSHEELVARARAWAEREGHDLRVVFDGEPPERAPDLIGTRYADDEIVRLSETLDRPVWVVTSDRALRAQLTGAERLLGGGAFLRAVREG